MANVRTNDISVPRIARNKRIYAGNTAISKSVQGGSSSPSLEWVSVTTEEVLINRDVRIDGDLTVQNLSGLAGDTVIVNENGTLATIREVINETPAGTIDGVNVTYTLAHIPDGLIRLYKNGQKLKLTTDYTIVDDVITLGVPLISDGYEDVLLCDYRFITYSPGGEPIPANVDQVGWTTMTRGAAAQVTNYDIQASRVGRSCTITGQFLAASNPPAGTAIASLPLADIADGMSLTNTIRQSVNEISGLETNRGMVFYVDTFNPSAKPTLRLLVDSEYDAGLINFTITFNII